MLAPPGAQDDKIVELLALGGMGSLDVRLLVEERRQVGADGDLLWPALEAKVLGCPLAEIHLNKFEKGSYMRLGIIQDRLRLDSATTSTSTSSWLWLRRGRLVTIRLDCSSLHSRLRHLIHAQATTVNKQDLATLQK